jgi:hypothetical protein
MRPRADRLPPCDQIAQLLGPETFDARPERDIRVLGHLRLEADELLDHVDRPRARALEQALTPEQRAVQLARAEDALCHR